jgi:hypothetical protein
VGAENLNNVRKKLSTPLKVNGSINLTDLLTPEEDGGIKLTTNHSIRFKVLEVGSIIGEEMVRCNLLYRVLSYKFLYC